MKKTTFPIRRKLRIVAAIARKDIGDAIKNRLILSMLIGAVVVILNVEALPFLLRNRIEPKATLFVVQDSVIATQIGRSQEISATLVNDAPAFQDALTSSSVPILGIPIPNDFDLAVDGGEAIELQSAYAHWVKPEQRTALETHFENELSSFLDLPVEISPGPADFFPSETTGGHLWMVTVGFVTIAFILGGFIVPILLTDEKESKTLDALLVSPAGYHDVVLGKAAAGLIYCLLGCSAILILEGRFVANAGLAALTLFLSSLMCVNIGLFIGSMSENPNTTNLWAGLMLMLVLAPLMLIFVFPSGFPETWSGLVEWIPSIAMARMMRLAMVDAIHLRGLLQAGGALIMWSGIFMTLTTWRVRREVN